MTWFIAIGAVNTLGAVVGVVWEKRRSAQAEELKADQKAIEEEATVSSS